MGDGALIHWVTTVAFISTVFSMALSFVAIWLALHFKSEADKVNERTVERLTEIRSHSIVITDFLKEQSQAITRIAIGNSKVEENEIVIEDSEAV